MKGVLGEQQQMLGLVGTEIVILVALLELHRFVAYPKRAHFEFTKILIAGRRRDGQRYLQHEDA